MIERPSGPPLCWASANANYSDALSDHQSIENQQQQQQQQQQQLQQHFGWIVVFFLNFDRHERRCHQGNGNRIRPPIKTQSKVIFFSCFKEKKERKFKKKRKKNRVTEEGAVGGGAVVVEDAVGQLAEAGAEGVGVATPVVRGVVQVVGPRRPFGAGPD